MPATRRRFADFLDTYLRHYLTQQDQANESRLVGDRQKEQGDINFNNQLMERVKSDPALAARLKANGTTKIGNYPIEAFISTDAERRGTVGGKISSASDLANLPTDSDIETSYFAQPGANPTDRAPIEQLIAEKNARDAYLRQNLSPIQADQYNPTTGANEKVFLPGDPRSLTGRTVQTSPTPTQAGQNQSTQATVAQPGLTAAKVAETNALAGPQARAAGMAAGSSAAAAAPYHPTWLVNEDGASVPVVSGPKGYHSLPQEGPPDDLYPVSHRNSDGTKPLPANALATVAVGNNAEIQGVKLLTALKASGLDKSTDPLDPRWNQFMMGTLKMKPDEATADINQRANFIEASMMKTLLAGRPNKTLIDLYSKHLAGATQTGQLMYHNLKLILEQNKGLRDQYEAQGYKVGQPVGGMTFDDWQKLDPGTADTPGTSPLDTARAKAKLLGGGL